MKGFFRRDFYHLMLNLRWYAIFLVVMGGLAISKEFTNISFINFYGMIFCASSLLGLFSYDDFNHWQGYAAATPGGRRAQVSGRYLLAFGLGVILTAVLTGLALVSGHREELGTSLLSSALFFLYTAIVFPLSYYFGTKSRLVLILVIAVVAGGAGVGGSILVISGTGATVASLVVIPVFAAAAISMAVSYWLSVRIMARKEL